MLFWLVILLFFPAILGAYALDGLLAPVQGMLAKLLDMLPNLLAGVVIGLLRPWQAEQLPAEKAQSAQDIPVVIPQRAVPGSLPNSPKTHENTTQDIVAAPAQQNATKHDADAQQQQVMQLYELPAAIQREIPDMAVQLHAYSSNPSERLVSINSIRLREGGYLMAGLKLEEITPDGMIFSYKGYRFKRGKR
jgi:hypothetical protein